MDDAAEFSDPELMELLVYRDEQAVDLPPMTTANIRILLGDEQFSAWSVRHRRP